MTDAPVTAPPGADGRPRHAAPAGRRPRRSAAHSRRFGAVTLCLAAFLGLSAGAAAGALLEVRRAATVVDAPVAAADRVPDATGQAPVVPDVPTPLVAGELSLEERALTAPALREPPPGPGPLPSPVPIEPLADPDALTAEDRAAGLLSRAVPAAASGQLVVVPGSQPAPQAARRVVTVRVEVEAGLEVDPALVAQKVMTTLNDPRGWGADGSVSFARTDGEAEMRVLLASPSLVDQFCAPLATVGTYSCGFEGRAVLNHTRWVEATPEFPDRVLYREYLVNHEVGHLLGHVHASCTGAGQPAPVMQQQTVQVAPCVPNGWPSG